MRVAFVLAVAYLLTGCGAGRTVTIRPESNRAQYQCGSYTIRPDGLFTDGLVVAHYLFIPFWIFTNNSKTDSQLEIPVTIHSSAEPVFDLRKEDVQIQVVTTGQVLSPSHVAIDTSNEIKSKPWYYKTYRFTFDINRHVTDSFVLIFPNAIHGCSIPKTLYIKEDRTHWATPSL